MAKKHSRSFNEDPIIPDGQKDVVTEENEDRSLYNCVECKGEGINVVSNLLCSRCGGTGKI